MRASRPPANAPGPWFGIPAEEGDPSAGSCVV
jgi:hypothetical protein